MLSRCTWIQAERNQCLLAREWNANFLPLANRGRDGLTDDTSLIAATRRFGPPELQGKGLNGAISHHEGFVGGWTEGGRAKMVIVPRRAQGEHSVLLREFTVVEVRPLAEARVKVPHGDHIRFKLLQSDLP